MVVGWLAPELRMSQIRPVNFLQYETNRVDQAGLSPRRTISCNGCVLIGLEIRHRDCGHSSPCMIDDYGVSLAFLLWSVTTQVLIKAQMR